MSRERLSALRGAYDAARRIRRPRPGATIDGVKFIFIKVLGLLPLNPLPHQRGGALIIDRRLRETLRTRNLLESHRETRGIHRTSYLSCDTWRDSFFNNEAQVAANLLLEGTHRVLRDARPWKWARWHRKIRDALEALDPTILPPKLKTSRTIRYLEVAFVCILTCNAILHFARHPKASRNRPIWQTLPTDEIRGWRKGVKSSQGRKALAKLIQRQQASLVYDTNRNTLGERGNLYSLNTTGMEYLGYFADDRAKNAKPGGIYRGLERSVLHARQGMKGSDRRRYVESRKTCLADFSFLITRRNHPFIAQLMETLGTRSLDPEEIEKKLGRKGRVGRRTTSRRRLPRWLRRARERVKSRHKNVDHASANPTIPPSRRNLFDTSSALRWLSRRLRTGEDPINADQRAGVWKIDDWARSLGSRLRHYRSAMDRGRWMLPYARSYVSTQRFIAAQRGGLEGPLDILS